MPNWSQILTEIDSKTNTPKALESMRNKYLKKISALTGRNVIAYYSGWLKGDSIPNTGIEEQDKNAFMTTIHQLDKNKGLDLILHTPGGEVAATEGILDYLKSMFGNDIRAFVPQISMSGGTMIAMACKEIIMGKQSSLGPIDPQIGGLACQAVVDEFEHAVSEVKKRPESTLLWQAIISQYRPTFLSDCSKAIEWSKEISKECLLSVNPDINLNAVYDKFLNHNSSYSHSRRISKQECREVGLPVTDLESNQDLQDAVMSLHHCYMITFDKYSISKIVENQLNSRLIQNYAPRNN